MFGIRLDCPQLVNTPDDIQSIGVMYIEYRRVPCEVTGNIEVRTGPHANQWNLPLLFKNMAGSGHLEKVEV